MSRHPRRRPQDDIKEMVLELLPGLLAATQLTSPAVCEAGNVCTRDRSAVAVSDEDLSCFTCEILTCEGLRRGDILGDGLRMKIGISWGVDYQDRLLFMGVEKQGKGEEYYNVMLRSAPFPVRDMTPGNMSKGKRFENQMAPLFKQGKVRVSNEPDNRFLDQFLGEWLAWDGTGHYFDDCLDAVYYAVALIKGFIKPSAEDIPGVRSIFDSVTKNPLFKFARR